jgi:site-specific recombinase XerD
MATEIDDLKRRFLEYLEIEKGSAIRTIENYGAYLDRFFEFTKAKKVGDITDESIREFRLWLNRQAAKKKSAGGAPIELVSKKTQNYYMIALRMFLKFLVKKDIKALAPERIELAKTPERALDLITSEELERLLNATNGSDLKSLRDKAILEMLFSTGLRVSELCSLPREISLTAEELSVRGKGGKVRVVFVSETARTALKKYLSARKDMEEGLFITLEPEGLKKNKTEAKEDKKKYTGKKYGNLDRRSVQRIIRHYATKAGLSKRVTPHTMRHLFATDLLSNGADIRSVQIMLGHANINTTQIYTHITDKHLREVHKKFHSKK